MPETPVQFLGWEDRWRDLAAAAGKKSKVNNNKNTFPYF